MNKKYRFHKLPLFDRFLLCFFILTHKEFYAMVVTSRYDNGKPLSLRVMTNTAHIRAAAERLRKSLNDELKYLKDWDDKVDDL